MYDNTKKAACVDFGMNGQNTERTVWENLCYAMFSGIINSVAKMPSSF